jgi:predicted molibdopterin-dependent oxidoreductase YjgC
MSTSPLFKKAPGAEGAQVTIRFDGVDLVVPADVSVAAALLASGVSNLRVTPGSGAPRAPYCMIGICFDCLVNIDGVQNRQACLVRIREGMRISTQQGALSFDEEQAT